MSLIVTYKAYLRSLFTPWRLATFAVGFAWLIWGAAYYQISDWDTGVSIVMAVTTFFTAEWCAAMLLRREWRMLPLVIFWTWLAVDGVYVVWHTWAGNVMLREDQWVTSLCLFYLCGFIWNFGSEYFRQRRS